MTSGKLSEGSSVIMEAGVIGPAKYRIKFYRGTWTGLASDSQPTMDYAIAETNPIIIAQTPEVTDWQEVIDWAATDEDFKNNFSYTSGTAGATMDADLVSFDYRTSECRLNAVSSLVRYFVLWLVVIIIYKHEGPTGDFESKFSSTLLIFSF